MPAAKSFPLAILLLSVCLESQAAENPQSTGHLRLQDDLDRPQDGYCLDIAGSGRYVRFDLPMTAHNCKPGLYPDEAVVLEANGYIRFPAYGKCATVAGINSRALPGASVLARDCGERSPFLDAEELQKFKLRADGYVELNNSGLCLTVGRVSDSTYAPDHRWRPLFVEQCKIADPARSRWEFSVPGISES